MKVSNFFEFENIIYEKTFKKYLLNVGNIFDCELLWLKDSIQYHLTFRF